MSSLPPARRDLIRASTLLGLAGLVSACSARIDPAASGLRLPTLFRAANAEPVPGAMRWPDATWWQAFHAPQLDALMRAAMAGNLDLAVAAARLRQADSEVRISGAALLPRVDADASAGRSRGTSRNLNTAGSAGNRFDAGFSASYEVDFWGRNRAILASARSSATAARYAIGVTALSTQAAVANALFNVLGAQEQLEIQRGNLEVATRNLAILRQRVAVGTATGLDVAQQETAVAQQRAAIPPLQQIAEQNSFALGTLTGVAPGEIDIRAVRLAEIVVPVIEPGLPAEVLARRPDVQLAEANLAAASANMAAARAALFPTIALTGSGGLQSLALETLLRPGSTVYSLAAGLTAPIFNAGSLRAQVDQFSARQAELLAEYQRTILVALQDTETSLSALRRTGESVQLQRVRAAAAQRAYAIAEAQLQAGTVDLLTVLNVQANLFSARNAVAQALTDRLQAAAALFTALGGGWTYAATAAAPFAQQAAAAAAGGGASLTR